MSHHSGGGTPPLQYPHRRSTRLTCYDYSQDGVYFVTVCTYGRECLFGKIRDGRVILNDYGVMVQTCWESIPVHFPNTTADDFVIMPNHMHGIIRIVGAGFPRPHTAEQQTGETIHLTGAETAPLQAKPTLGQIVAYFKYRSAKQINELRKTPGWPVWQRNYYEHIIRREDDFWRIREYIRTNPAQWDTDNENPVFWF